MPRPAAILLLACLQHGPISADAGPPSSPPVDPPRLLWTAPDGTPAWSVSLDPGAVEGSAVRDLMAASWYPPLPAVTFRLHDGGSLDLLSASRGKVLLLDFWASWCAPCIHELPQVQALHEARRADGLMVVTVNARESEEAANIAVRGLGLRLPVAFYDDAVDEAFRIRALPTVILVDREGRIRNRWDSYVPDFDAEIGARARALLVERPEERMRKVAEVMAGGDALRVRWMRELPGPVSGAAWVRDAEGRPGVAATAGDFLMVLRGDGATVTRRRLPPGAAGKLRSVPGAAQSGWDLLSFRPGRPEVVWIDSRAESLRQVPSASPVLDAAILSGQGSGAGSAPRAILGGTAGLAEAGAEGDAAPWPDVSGEIASVRVTRTDGMVRVAALGADGLLRWLDGTGRRVRESKVPSASRTLVLTRGSVPGVGLLPGGTRGTALGRFLGDDRVQVAVATAAGEILLLDLADGAVRFRARWAGIEDLASGDLDGDGVDELLVAAGRSLAVLGRPPS